MPKSNKNLYKIIFYSDLEKFILIKKRKSFQQEFFKVELRNHLWSATKLAFSLTTPFSLFFPVATK